MAQTFALVDCNNFFVSCERVFNPGLEGRPVVVLSNNDGCIISRSNEAKALGIPMGAPLFKVKNIVQNHRVVVHSAHFAMYGDLSHRVFQTLETFTSDIEVYSIDEAFLDLSNIPADSRAPLGRQIRQRIRQWTGIPVSVGIAPTKTLAKVAAEIAKKSDKAQGVLDLSTPAYQTIALERLAVQDVWGVGWRLGPQLRSRGIVTAKDLCDADLDWILRRFGTVLARTVAELGGTSCIPLNQCPEPAKSVISSRSFGTPITTLPHLLEAVAAYTARAAEKLRSQGLAASALTVYIKTNRHRPDQPQYANSITLTLPVASDYTAALVQAAHQGLARIYQDGFAYNKAGVMLTGLMPANQRQANLLVPSDWQKTSRLMQAVDRLNRVWGTGTVRLAAEGFLKPWQMKSEHRSRWGRVLHVRT
jgi:DNA polymerase V